MDLIEKHLYEEPEDRENEDYNNLQSIEEEEEEMNENYEPMENKRDCSLVYVYL